MAEVDWGHLDLFAPDVFPYIPLGPVAERKDTHVFARVEARVVEVPDFRSLVLRIPLAKTVAEAEEALLGAGLFLVAPRTADAAVELEFIDRGEQRGDLQPVPADLAWRRHGPALRDRILHPADDEPRAEFPGATVAEFVHLGKMVPGIHIEQRHGGSRRAEGLLRQAKETDRILAAGEE